MNKTHLNDTNLILFNKPFGVLCQFTGSQPNLSNYIEINGFYPAGRLDKDSEGLLLLTNNGSLQARISSPKFKMGKTYWIQVEGEIPERAIAQLEQGVELKDGLTRPAQAVRIKAPLPDRTPPIRTRKNQPTSWLELTIFEGKNRQVRRMTANVGFPTLRLFRSTIGPWAINTIDIGQHESQKVNLPV